MDRLDSDGLTDHPIGNGMAQVAPLGNPGHAVMLKPAGRAAAAGVGDKTSHEFNVCFSTAPRMKKP